MRRAWIHVVVAGSLAITSLAGCTVTPDRPPAVEPGNAKSYYLRGAYYHGRGVDVAPAIADYTMAIQIDPNYVDAYAKRGLANIGADWEASVRDFGRAIALAPKEHRLYYWRAIAHTMNDDIDQAVADYEKVIALKPGSSEAYWSYFHRAQKLESHGRIDEAIRAYQEFLNKAGTPPAQPTSHDQSALVGALVASASSGHPFGAAVGLGVAVLPMLIDPMFSRQKDHTNAKERISALKEIALEHERIGGGSALSGIVVGMSKNEVLARTLGDGYYVALKPDVVVAVSRSGNTEDRTLVVLQFLGEALVSREDFQLSELMALPEPDEEAAVQGIGQVDFSMGRPEVLERLEQGAKIILKDDDCIAAVAYHPPAKGKRILVFNFTKEGGLTSYGSRSRKLW